MAAVKAKSVSSKHRYSYFAYFICILELRQGTSSNQLLPNIRPGAMSEKVSTKPLEYDKSSQMKKNQSVKSVRFDPETLIHSSDRTTSGKLKKASMQVMAATSKTLGVRITIHFYS